MVQRLTVELGLVIFNMFIVTYDSETHNPLGILVCTIKVSFIPPNKWFLASTSYSNDEKSIVP